MNVILDLDNTLFYNDVVDNVCAKHGIPKTKRFDLTDMPMDAQKECWDGFENVDLMCNLEPFEEAKNIDVFLKNRAHVVYAVSARSLNLEPYTTYMVKRHFPYLDKTILIGSYDKGALYKSLEADVVVDDHAEHIYQALDAGVKHVYMISNEHTLYNHDDVQNVIDKGGIVISSLDAFKARHQ